MKSMFLLIISILICCVPVQDCFSQKYDNTWIVGYGGKDSPYRPYGTTNIFFTSGKVDTQYVLREVNFSRASMSVSDPLNGNLILYSNGCELYGSEDKIISNGQNINPGYQHDIWCPLGYPMPKSGCFLPNPNELKPEYFMIHRASGEGILRSVVAKLYYTLVVKEHNSWIVKEKNKILLNQYLLDGSFEVVKHSNDKDWWILSYNFPPDTSFSFLLTENGIQGPYKQYLPLPHSENDYYVNSILSPNGKKEILIDIRSGLTIMDFNRENGEYSNLQHWPFWITNKDSIENIDVIGISVSPNSRYLYISSPLNLWQFDLDASDVVATRILIDTFDRFKSPFYTTFYNHQLAPDGKIYINCTNGVDYMHVINYPDKPGKACDFRQHDLKLPTYNAFTLPYFPNYRLGPITSTTNDDRDNLFVYPNPASDKIKISIPTKGIYHITNSIGQHIFSTSKEEIDISKLPSGIYFLSVYSNGQKLNKAWKLIKL